MEAPDLQASQREFSLLATESYDRFIKSSSGRQRLDDIVRAVLKNRVETNFLGYEKSEDFADDLWSTYQAFRDALSAQQADGVVGGYVRDLRREFSTDGEVVELGLRSLRANKIKFKSFYSTIVSRDPLLRSYSSGDIESAMLAFSMAVYSRDRNLWARASQRSYFWPVCRRSSDAAGRSAEQAQEEDEDHGADRDLSESEAVGFLRMFERGDLRKVFREKAGKSLRQVNGEEAFVTQFTRVREQLGGASFDRQLIDESPLNQLPNTTIQGTFFHFRYKSKYPMGAAYEDVYLEKEEDGSWKIVGAWFSPASE